MVKLNLYLPLKWTPGLVSGEPFCTKSPQNNNPHKRKQQNTLLDRKRFKVDYFNVFQPVCALHEHHTLLDKHRNDIQLIAILDSIDL